MHYSGFRPNQINPALSAITQPIDTNNALMGNRRYPTKQDASKINLLYECDISWMEAFANVSKVLVIGGRDGAAGSSMELYHPFNPQLNHALNVNIEFRSMHTSALLSDHTVVTVGGRQGVYPDYIYLASCEHYKPLTNSITQCPSLHIGRGGLASAVLDGVLYICGGATSNGSVASCVRLLGNAWNYSLPMNTNRSIFTMESLDGDLYVMGGWDGGSHLSSVEKFNVTHNQWSYVKSMDHKRGGHASAVIHGSITVCGGLDGIGHLATCQQYIAVGDQWVYIAEMQRKRTFFTLVTGGKLLFAMGGDWSSSLFDDGPRYLTVEMYNSGNDTWTMIEKQLIYKRQYHSALLVS